MITLILIVHISLAVLSLGFASGVILAAKKQSIKAAHNRTKTMWYGTVSTVVSGVLLAVTTGTSLGRTCATLLTFFVLVIFAHYYQRSVRHKISLPLSR